MEERLAELIAARENELKLLLENRGTDFPIVERRNDLRIAFLELELEDLKRLDKELEFDENQKIVLDWMKREFTMLGTGNVIAIAFLVHLENMKTTPKHMEMWSIYRELSTKQEAEILREFSEWVLKKEEDKTKEG